MSFIKSRLKTWLKRNGFLSERRWGPRTPMRETIGYVARSGRNFRIRQTAGEVDIGEVYATFDRWANSRERVVTIDEFKREFGK